MYYGEIKKTSVVDGLGVRVSLYVSGCRLHCEGCHNQAAWNFCYGKVFDENAEKELFDALEHSYIKGLSILGGEPFEEENQQVLAGLIQRYKEKFPEKDLWIWTGYELEELKTVKHCEYTDTILNNTDVIITGRFEIDKRDISGNNLWRGSTNQQVIKLK